MNAYRAGCCAVALIGAMVASGAATAKDYGKADRAQQSGYSLAVITEGGKTVWLGGQTGYVDDNGKSLADDFDGQVHHSDPILSAPAEVSPS